MAIETITSNPNYQELRNGGQSVLSGLLQLSSVLHSIKLLTKAAAERPDVMGSLDHIAALADLGAEQASTHADRTADLNDIIDDLDKPVIDMVKSGLQADCIQQSLVALLQVIPDDQTETIGSLKSVLKLANDLSTHLISGGRYKFVLKEALDEADGIVSGVAA